MTEKFPAEKAFLSFLGLTETWHNYYLKQDNNTQIPPHKSLIVVCNNSYIFGRMTVIIKQLTDSSPQTTNSMYQLIHTYLAKIIELLQYS
jgi:hypothetical protein